jgi:hypothetical protein
MMDNPYGFNYPKKEGIWTTTKYGTVVKIDSCVLLFMPLAGNHSLKSLIEMKLAWWKIQREVSKSRLNII